MILLVLLIVAANIAKWRILRNRSLELSISPLEQEQMDIIGDSLRNAAKWPKKSIDPVSELIMPVYFDPNRADSVELKQLGLSAYVVRNIIRYRMAGGVFREPGDLGKIYGLSEELFSQIESYIRIEGRSFQKITVDSLSLSKGKTGFVDTTEIQSRKQYHKINKITRGEVVDINIADTSTLMTIPGIGRGYASMIVSYREKLGGFVNTEQLLEIESLPDSLLEWFVVRDTVVTPIYINKASVKQLRDHPYLDFYQARIIVEHRDKNGNISSLAQLSLYQEFTEQDLKRLSPYICYD